MMHETSEHLPRTVARAAGVLYLIIIVLGLFGELVVRSSLIAPGDAATTASNILASTGLFRTGFVADSIMVLCDVALAALLFVLLRPVNRVLAIVALLFRLAQAAVLALNLLNYHAAMLVLTGAAGPAAFDEAQVASLASLFLDLHSHGYDLGLILFGVHCLVLGYLITKSSFLPRTLGYLGGAAGVVYLVGSYVRFVVPTMVETVAPIYLVAIVAELSLCGWLLIKGVDRDRWMARAGRMREAGCGA